MSTDLVGLLRATELLATVPTAELEALAAGSRIRTFRRGQVVFTAGEPGETVMVVISGRVKVMVRSADGGELTLTVIGPGALFGENGVADGGPRSADCEALQESRLLLIPREMIVDLSGRVPAVALVLLRSVTANLRRLTEATSDLVFLDLPRRVAKVLLGQPRGDDGVISPGLSQEELAHQAGGSRQSVNAALRGFERRGWIHVSGRTVTVRQVDALNRFSGS
jgi:CRP/FNR family transcriptional regulator, cyclic AMP receptor protein